MKIFLILDQPLQIEYLGKFLFMGYGPKYSQPMRFQDFRKSTFSIRKECMKLIFLHMVRHLQKHPIDLDILSGLDQTLSDMPNVLQNHESVISQK